MSSLVNPYFGLKKNISISNLFDVFFLLAGITFITLGRWSSIVFPYPLNPDEVQMAANALRIKSFGWNWNAVDGATGGPLDSLALLWPSLFNNDVTLSLVRITANALLCIVFILIYLSIKNISSRKYAVLMSISLALFYGLTKFYDFTHYSSELLPVTLAMAANYLILNKFQNSSSLNQSYVTDTVIGLLIGSIFFVKLQAIPLVPLMFLFNIYIIFYTPIKQKIYHLVVFSLASFLPFVIFLLPLYLNHHFIDFYNSYIIFAINYVKTPLTLPLLYNMITQDYVLSMSFYFWGLITIFGAISLLFFGKFQRKNAVILYLFLLLLASIYLVIKPGSAGSYHYLMLSLPFLVLFAGCIFNYTNNNNIVRNTAIYFICLLLLTSFAYPAYTSLSKTGIFSNYLTVYKRPLEFNIQLKNPEIYSWLPLERNIGLIWGWMPQWYVWGNLTPASRETNNLVQIRSKSLTPYFRQRFIRDFRESSPDIVVDAVVTGSFGLSDNRREGIGSFAELSEIIKRDYQLVIEDGFAQQNCPKLYLKNSVYEKYENTLVKIKSIIPKTQNANIDKLHPLKNLNDNSVTEDSCTDYWLLPDNQLGSFKINFIHTYPVNKIMILNTNNSQNLDRSTTKVRYSLLRNNKVVYSEETNLKPHPQWTVIQVPIHQSDSLVIDILGFKGVGAGLNEVKIFHTS